MSGRSKCLRQGNALIDDPCSFTGYDQVWEIELNTPKPTCLKRFVWCAKDRLRGDANGRNVGMRLNIARSGAAAIAGKLNLTAITKCGIVAMKKTETSYRLKKLAFKLASSALRRPLAGVRSTMSIVLLATLSLVGGFAAADEVALPDKQDAIIFIRHALAPGTGDPAEFDVNLCTTQRNLSEQGRRQAQDIGRKLLTLGFADTPVYTSEWCRCRETAELMNIGPVQNQPLLNSFFASPSSGPAQLRKLGQWLSVTEGPLILITHQVVITGMTDVYPSSGEMVVASLNADGVLSVLSTIETEYR